MDSKGQLQGKDLKSGLKGNVGSFPKAKASAGGLGIRKQHLKEKDTSGGILGECSGVIENRGPKYGFIETEKHGKVFVLADELKDFQKGQSVTFTVYTDKAGRVQAKDLSQED